MTPTPGAAGAVPGPLDPILIDRISVALTDLGIAHGTLVEGPPHLNANLSDHRRVFVKVSRAGEERDRAATEILAATWAHGHGIACAQPLLAAPLEVLDAEDQPRSVTVLDYQPLCVAPSLLDRSRDVADLLLRIAATPPPPGLGAYPHAFYLDRVRRRLTGRPGPEAARVLTVAETAGATVTRLLPTRPVRWSHSDLHLANLGWCVNGTALVLDWESSSLAPVEVDLAQTLRTIDTLGAGFAPDYRLDAARTIVGRVSEHHDIDWDLVAALARFRAASHASHLLVHGHEPDLLGRTLAFLDQPLGWLPHPATGSEPIAS